MHGRQLQAGIFFINSCSQHNKKAIDTTCTMLGVGNEKSGISKSKVFVT